ncbi:SRPBCC family protein [Parasediminibacterium sp. JCM 36343]|uniref:SRPBCC family protein n=1 Tax=Parasediminibacterium sp. JCM 36343 TaxID=3374279 RepID=UPI00397CFC77
MKALKIIFIVLVAIVAVALIVAAFAKKTYSVEREIVINKPKAQVFNYIKYLKNQDSYSKWAKMDTEMRKEYKGIDGTVGFTSAWESDKKDVGQGIQEIKKITEGEKLEMGIHFIKPFDGLADAEITTIALDSTKTKVTWGFQSKMNYPMNLMLLFMDMEKMIGGDLAIGLGNLKSILEK